MTESHPETPQATPRKLDPVTRARVIMAFWAFLLTGVALILFVVLLGRMVRRRARLRLEPSRFTTPTSTAGPLPPRDPPADLPPGLSDQETIS